MKEIRDGWHVICGYHVYVESGRVIRGMTEGWQAKTIYPYRVHYVWRDSINGKCRAEDGWDNCSGISVAAFQAGVRRGTVCME